jgi:benzoyl-CoA reductase/2-hydroxyglutaryl-CoA dehydratase subunit BcrC/BadD/HgdB
MLIKRNKALEKSGINEITLNEFKKIIIDSIEEAETDLEIYLKLAIFIECFRRRIE